MYIISQVFHTRVNPTSFRSLVNLEYCSPRSSLLLSVLHLHQAQPLSLARYPITNVITNSALSRCPALFNRPLHEPLVHFHLATNRMSRQSHWCCAQLESGLIASTFLAGYSLFLLLHKTLASLSSDLLHLLPVLNGRRCIHLNERKSDPMSRSVTLDELTRDGKLSTGSTHNFVHGAASRSGSQLHELLHSSSTDTRVSLSTMNSRMNSST
jgi:hypothetical protein